MKKYNIVDKESYEPPKMEVIEFTVEDIITTSATLQCNSYDWGMEIE